MLGGLESSRLSTPFSDRKPSARAPYGRPEAKALRRLARSPKRYGCVCRSLRGVKANWRQYIINASQPASDKIFDVSAFEKFLNEKIKVDNRTGNLGDNIKISQAGDGKIEVVAHMEFSGRYLKYL